MQLAPGIQEAVLFLAPAESRRELVHEQRLRRVAVVIDWGRQRTMWRALVMRSLSHSKPPTASVRTSAHWMMDMLTSGAAANAGTGTLGMDSWLWMESRFALGGNPIFAAARNATERPFQSPCGLG